MTAPVRVDWSASHLQAMGHLRLRICGQRYREYRDPAQRVRSGLYAIGYANDGSRHAVRIVPVVEEVSAIFNALTCVTQVSEARARIADTFRQIALCGVEAHLDGGLDAAKPWIPLPDSCKGCVAKC